MFNLLHSSTNQELFEKHLCNQSSHQGSHYKNYKLLLLRREAITSYCQINTFCCEWNAKEVTGKSMKNVLYILQCTKGTSWVKAMSNSEKIKPIALTVIELCLSEGISQSVENFVQ